jgi:hypothetical protein
MLGQETAIIRLAGRIWQAYRTCRPSNGLPSRLALSAFALILCLGVASAAQADRIDFGKGWTEQRFSLFSSNSFDPQGTSLAIESNGTVSLLWKRLLPRFWQTSKASWRWQVREGVPATDLTRKGGDDRNLALYFIFLPQKTAENAGDAGISALLDAADVRVLMYVWGGDHPVGAILPTPYLGERGRTVVRRGIGTGMADEAIDLANDYRAAFGEPPQSLVGLAISADSDDTDTRIIASIGNLTLLR